MRRNGGVKAQKELTREQAQQNLRTAQHRQNTQQAQELQKEWDRKKAEYLDRLLETGMSEPGVDIVGNILDGVWALGNISDAEYHDIKWWLRGLYIEIRSEFPPQGSGVTDDLRRFILDDKDEGLSPLAGRQKIIIGEIIQGLAVWVSRSIDGFQQEMLVKSISVSEIMDEDQEEDNLKLGLFG